MITSTNGLELLNFFAEALEEKDVLENPLLKPGDMVIMDNYTCHVQNFFQTLWIHTLNYSTEYGEFARV